MPRRIDEIRGAWTSEVHKTVLSLAFENFPRQAVYLNLKLLDAWSVFNVSIIWIPLSFSTQRNRAVWGTERGTFTGL
jgi:hypothetical protein